MVLQLELTGPSFSSSNMSGIASNTTPKLRARWMGGGSLLPFFRGHSERGTNDHESWLFLEGTS